MSASGKSANAHKVSFDSPNEGLEALHGDTAGFQMLSEVLKKKCGIDLPPTAKNLSLMASRMRKVLARYQLQTYKEFASLLQKGDGEVMNSFISALTTNTTHFFREREHFDYLASALPSFLAEKKRAGAKELRVWCAAASTGQEPYTILMTVNEALEKERLDLKFLSTDIDLQVLQKALNGTYTKEEADGVPADLRGKYFQQVVQNGGAFYQVKNEYRQKIRFAPLNLMEPQFPFQHKFDIIFCRNVLIYFDQATAQGVVNKLVDQLAPGGFLFVGHSECGQVRNTRIKTIKPAAYKLGK